MLRPPFKRILLASAALGLAACADAPDSTSGSPNLMEPSYIRIPDACSTADLSPLAREYFSNPQRSEATALLHDLEVACAAEDAYAAETSGWGVLGLIEHALDNGAGGPALAGAALANGVMRVMCEGGELCDGLEKDFDEVTLGVFAEDGLFSIREGNSSTPAVARRAIEFTDYDNVANAARWGIETEPGSDWHAATLQSKILFYGARSEDEGAPEPTAGTIADLGYTLSTFPNVDHFTEGLLHVGICYRVDVGFPHVGGEGSKEQVGRLLREENILETWIPRFSGCRTSISTAGFGGAIRELAGVAGGLFSPRPLFAALMTDRKAPATGGTPIDFSRFMLLAVDPDARLTWHWASGEPTADDEIFSGQQLGPLTVRAESAAGIPFENVFVTLFVAGNSGSPAGANLCTGSGGESYPMCVEGSLVAPTQEESTGLDPKAVFPTVTLNKAGGYILCAQGAYRSDPELAFAQVCTELFNVKNGR